MRLIEAEIGKVVSAFMVFLLRFLKKGPCFFLIDILNETSQYEVFSSTFLTEAVRIEALSVHLQKELVNSGPSNHPTNLI